MSQPLRVVRAISWESLMITFQEMQALLNLWQFFARKNSRDRKVKVHTLTML